MMINQVILVLGRVIREPVVHSAAALASVPATAAGLHAVGVSTELDPAVLANGLFEPKLWITLGIAAAFGGLGGIVAELISLHGRIELPHRVRRGTKARRSRLAEPRYEIDLGIFSRLLLGAAAALALLSLYAPTSSTALIVNALIGGSAATGVFRLTQGRLLAKTQGTEARPAKPAAKPQLTIVGATPSSVAH